jgi:Cys-tRNA(Pro) deacylase
VIKTIVLETSGKKPLICLMHGDRQISTKQLARVLGDKTVTPCDPTVAQRHTGYQVGGTSPFGTRKALPVYVERSILELGEIYINAGGRGLLVSIAPEVVTRLLSAVPVDVATDAG